MRSLPPGIFYQGEVSCMYVLVLFIVCVILIKPLDPGYSTVFGSKILVLSEFLGAFFCLHLDKPPLVYFASLDVGLAILISKPLRCLFEGVLAFPFLLKCVDITLISPLSASLRFCVALAFRSDSRSFPRLADSNTLLRMVGAMDWCSAVISVPHFGLANSKAVLSHGWRLLVHTGIPTSIVFGSLALVIVFYIDGLGHKLYWRFSSLFLF